MAAYARPAIPHFEAERLRELYALRLLDSQLEERFQRFTDLAADVFDVPIALITVIDQHRMWFKAACGWESGEKRRSESFCGHAIAADESLVVPDTADDPRFAANPLVVGPPGIRFYAGAPVRGPSGLPLGTLCLIDTTPRDFGSSDLNRLKRMAGMVEREVCQSYQIDLLRQELERSAYYDPLTALPNQRLFMDRLIHALRMSETSGNSVLVALIDVHSFGAFNHSHGWEGGNALLRSIAAGLSRDSPEPCTVARWHGDQFAVLDPSLPGGRDPHGIAETIQQTFARPFRVAGDDTHVDAKIGISVSPTHGQDPNELIRHAITAMRAGGPGYRIYSGDLEVGRARRLAVADRLRRAVQHNAVDLAYQVKLGIDGRRLCGVEALARWQDEVLGPVPAEELFSVAEETGLTYRLGLQLLIKACRQASKWMSEGLEIPVAVNLTANQLRHPEFVERVLETLEKTRLPGERLMLEVTESALVDVDDAAQKMRALAEHGIGFAIDDFGTGYSSFAYLAQLPVDSVKIDRRFVTPLGDDNSAAKVVTGIIQLAHGLDMEVVAEGVETSAQVGFLREADCDELQGFYFSRALTPDDLAQYVRHFDR